jgi:hypothetical protein
MTIRSRSRFMLSLLALGLTLVMAAPVIAQTRDGRRPAGTSATLRVRFGTTPRWDRAPAGMSVRQIREQDRPDYDMFRYGGSYYAYHDNQWYRSRRGQGDYRWINERQVPQQFHQVPPEHWRNYPSGWRGERQPGVSVPPTTDDGRHH